MRQEQRNFLFTAVPDKGTSQGAEKIFPDLEGSNAKEQGASKAAENPDF